MNIPQGLSLEPGVITLEKEQEIIEWLDKRSWSCELSRRIQYYGYSYNYRNKNIVPTLPLEGPILEIANLLESAKLATPVQCIVNEYYRNQGISCHIDNLKFGSTIICVSIGADGVLVFERGMERFNCFLPRGSVMMITGSARYEWKHSIEKRETYVDSNGNTIVKPTDYRRISITYRELSNNQYV